MLKHTHKVVHITTAHDRYDTRIFHKMCTSLQENEKFEVSLIVADGKGNEIKNGVSIIDIGPKTGGRISRMTKSVNKALYSALELKADIYHLHDPELMQIAIRLKKAKAKVIFDAHEDLPVQILSKPYLSPLISRTISSIAYMVEKLICSRIDGVVCATPYIRDKFLKINPNSIDVNNFPKLEEFDTKNSTDFKDRMSCCYVGGVTKVRGITENVKAMNMVKSNCQLLIAGNFLTDELRNEIMTIDGWSKVQELGYLDRDGVKNTLNSSFAGLVTLHPIRNYLDALPVKMFEYMAAGIPVIYTDIEYWKTIVEPEKCGIAVNPFDSEDVAGAIDKLAYNLPLAEEMGQNGRRAVMEKYNWGIEEKRLINFYEGIL